MRLKGTSINIDWLKMLVLDTLKENEVFIVQPLTVEEQLRGESFENHPEKFIKIIVEAKNT